MNLGVMRSMTPTACREAAGLPGKCFGFSGGGGSGGVRNSVLHSLDPDPFAYFIASLPGDQVLASGFGIASVESVGFRGISISVFLGLFG